MSEQTQQQTAKGHCDNPLCPNWHGESGVLRMHKYHNLPLDTTCYNVWTIGKVKYTTCLVCERAIDMFVGYYKHSTSNTSKKV